MISDSKGVYVDSLIKDWNRDELEAGALKKVRSADFSLLESFDIAGMRIGSPVARPTKLICIGLNYARHAAESGMTPPPEPVVFMKAPDCLVGPNDDIIIPPNSTATDYEVELAIVIGKRALYLKSEAEARDYILGYSMSQDVSERHWQIERAGQWVKGKSFPTYNPMGPVLVTGDEFEPDDVRVYCTVDGEKRQDSRTSDLIFGISHIVWYVSQFMELHPGDVINTGTPEGVGMGFKPTKYLRAGQEVITGIEGIGEMRSKTVAHN
jgi:2-keto-4-pentenoate hydratase/2-oxohepta-3-ene-1,7-dioic acid hydratase in catechol pathway